MEAINNLETVQPRELTAIKRMRFYYLEKDTAKRLDSILQDFTDTPLNYDLLGQLREVVPISKRDHSSVKQHVEGMFYVSEKLWNIALETGRNTWGEKFSRENLRRMTKSIPMSHYCYLVGSREAPNVLLTRNDALQDPGTAMVKLEHDISSLVDFIVNSQIKV